MEFTDVDNANILQNLLNERYIASHKMRERSLKFTLWLLGYVAILDSWLVISGSSLFLNQKIALTILTLTITTLTLFFLHDIEKGFIFNRKIIIKIEDALGFYEVNRFIKSDTILPRDYKKLHNSYFKGHFSTINAWIILVFLLTIILIWWGHLANDISGTNKKPSIEIINHQIINNQNNDGG